MGYSKFNLKKSNKKRIKFNSNLIFIVGTKQFMNILISNSNLSQINNLNKSKKNNK